MESIKIQHFASPFGEMILGAYNEQLCMCDWRYRKMRTAIDNRLKKSLNAQYVEEKSDVVDLAISQLNEYFNGTRKEFEIPLLLVGSDFQKTVWKALLEVPYGSIETYAALSKRINNIPAIRAVATANGANAISIIVPCHRIIGSDGKLIGYAGGLKAKKELLELESKDNFKQMDLFDCSEL